ncbi:Protein kinase, ATP binding site [Phytophthora cactorum]|nr:Protein kinase, ATP binding site [Phytophthora cactorum]
MDQLQSVYDRVERNNDCRKLRNHQLEFSLFRSTASGSRASSANFRGRDASNADTTDEQTKSNLIRSLDDTLNQVDDLTCWYSVGKEIGRGTFGRVRLATHRLSGTPVAIKSYGRLHGARSCLPVDGRVSEDFSGDALEWRRVRQEVRVLSRLRTHPNIMRFVKSLKPQHEYTSSLNS